MSVVHADDGKLVHGCSKCDRKFSHLFLLKNHEQSHLPYDQRQFGCDKCLDGKKFPTFNRLRAHEKQVCAFSSLFIDVKREIQGLTRLKRSFFDQLIFEMKASFRFMVMCFKNNLDKQIQIERTVL